MICYHMINYDYMGLIDPTYIYISIIIEMMSLVDWSIIWNHNNWMNKLVSATTYATRIMEETDFGDLLNNFH